MFEVKAYGYNKDDLTKRVPLKISDEAKYYKFLKTIAEEYPFLTVMGLRIITEIKLKDLLKTQEFKCLRKPRRRKKKIFSPDALDRATLGVLIENLPNSIPAAQKEILFDFNEFENIASHGYEISKETAKWAVDAIPAFLEGIK